MKMGSQLLSLYTCAHASRIKRLTAYLPMSIRRAYKEGSSGGYGIDEERAPSTAEEFKRVAEEKSHQGFVSHTADKAADAAEEAVDSNAKFDSVKEAHKEPPGKGDFHRRGDDNSSS